MERIRRRRTFADRELDTVLPPTSSVLVETSPDPYFMQYGYDVQTSSNKMIADSPVDHQYSMGYMMTMQPELDKLLNNNDSKIRVVHESKLKDHLFPNTNLELPKPTDRPKLSFSIESIIGIQ